MKASKKIKIIFTSLFISGSFLLVSFVQQDDPWVVPAKYKNMKNPYKGKDVATGKSLYRRHCKMCHGSKGQAGTPKARQLNYEGVLYGKAFGSQTDGEIYYKSIIGRKETGMPNYEKKIADERDRWAVVNYIRTLKE